MVSYVALATSGHKETQGMFPGCPYPLQTLLVDLLVSMIVFVDVEQAYKLCMVSERRNS